jgi:hypothetical protein
MRKRTRGTSVFSAIPEIQKLVRTKDISSEWLLENSVVIALSIWRSLSGIASSYGALVRPSMASLAPDSPRVWKDQFAACLRMKTDLRSTYF